MKHVCMISWILVVVGAVNWGLYGLVDMNLVAMLLGGMPMVAKAVYALIGLSGLLAAYQMMTGKCAKK